MLVHKFLFDRKALNSLEGVFHHPGHVILGGLERLCFDIAPASEFDAALLARCDGVVGAVVGEFEDGYPALCAGEFDFYAVGSH